MIYTAITINDKEKKIQHRIIHTGFDYNDAVKYIVKNYPDEHVLALVKGNHDSSTYCVAYKEKGA